MNRLSAIDAFGPAISRVSDMLFKPFRLGTWIKMGFIGLLGGGVAAFNMNFRGPMVPSRPAGNFPNDPFYEMRRAMGSIHLADYAHLIMIGVAVGIAIALVFLYLFCRFRFVLFDSVISGKPTVGRGWRQYASQANRYFGFWLAFRLVMLVAIFYIVGVPLWHAYKSGVFGEDNSVIALFQLLSSLALRAILIGAVFGIVSTLMKDFIMPIMALDDLLIGDAWSSLWKVIASEPAAWLGYIGMKVVFAIGANIVLAIAGAIAAVPAFLIIGIPVAVLAVPGVIALKAGATVVAGILLGLAAVLGAAGFCCFYMILIAPLTVFFPAYAFYFFGGRYPKLGALLWPQAPSPTPAPQMAGTQPAI